MHTSQKHSLLPLKELFSNKKIVESHLLNYAGAQILRVLLSSVAYSCRRILKPWPSTDLTTMLRKNGFIIIPNFLSRNDFQQVKYEFLNKAEVGFYSQINDGDTKTASELIHDEFKFLMHASGKTLTKDDVVKWVGMKDVKKDKVRILFENAEVGFDHAIVSFKDGNKEAVMSYYKFKDGKVVYQETGATKLTK